MSLNVIFMGTPQIAAEYLNSLPGDAKAISLVTAGPGITNSLTGISGANLESRELLVIGGTVKTIDISSEKLRQRGIQEINGQDTVKPLAKFSERIPLNIDIKGVSLSISKYLKEQYNSKWNLFLNSGIGFSSINASSKINLSKLYYGSGTIKIKCSSCGKLKMYTNNLTLTPKLSLGIERNINDRFSGAVPFLNAFARVLGGYFHLKSAIQEEHVGPRTKLARFYILNLLPEYIGLLQQAQQGCEDLYSFSPNEMLEA